MRIRTINVTGLTELDETADRAGALARRTNLDYNIMMNNVIL